MQRTKECGALCSACIPISTCLECLRWQVPQQQAPQVLCSICSPPVMNCWGELVACLMAVSHHQGHRLPLPYLVSKRGKTKGWTSKRKCSGFQLSCLYTGLGQCGIQTPSYTLVGMLPQGLCSALPGISLHRKLPDPQRTETTLRRSILWDIKLSSPLQTVSLGLLSVCLVINLVSPTGLSASCCSGPRPLPFGQCLVTPALWVLALLAQCSQRPLEDLGEGQEGWPWFLFFSL